MAEEEGNRLKDYMRCYTPLRAVEYLQRELLTADEAKAAILERLAMGALSAMAHRGVLDSGQHPILGGEVVTDFPNIVRTAWTTRKIPDEFWKTGDINFPNRGLKFRPMLSVDGPAAYFAVRFDRVGIDLMVERASDWKAANTVLSLPNRTANLKRRGPKPKAFWSPLMRDVEVSISVGELQPSCLADIERAMNAWLDQHDVEAGESSVRKRARIVWQRVEKEVANSALNTNLGLSKSHLPD